MITSVGNRTVKAVRRLGKRPWRERQGLLLCEGHRALASALASGTRIEHVLHTATAKRLRSDLLAEAKRAGAEVLGVSPGIMRYLTTLVSAPDILAVVARREGTLEAQRCDPGVVLLSEVRDPAAAGAILASARAVGFNGAAQAKGSVDVFDRKAIRAGQGAQLSLDVVRDVDEKDAVVHHRANGAGIVALTDQGKDPWDVVLPSPVLFVIEGEGTSGAPTAAALADEQVALPAGTSVAGRAAMLLYEWMRQQKT